MIVRDVAEGGLCHFAPDNADKRREHSEHSPFGVKSNSLHRTFSLEWRLVDFYLYPSSLIIIHLASFSSCVFVLLLLLFRQLFRNHHASHRRPLPCPWFHTANFFRQCGNQDFGSKRSAHYQQARNYPHLKRQETFELVDDFQGAQFFESFPPLL